MQPPIPISSKVLSGSGLISPEWQGYFVQRQAKNQKNWEPDLVNLTGGVLEVTGFWTVSERTFTFSVRIAPSSPLSSVLNSSYFELPFPSIADGAALAFNTTSKALLGAALIMSGKVYLPTFTSVNDPISISGTVQIGNQNG